MKKIKQLAAMLTILVMLSATVMGATSYTLADYPSPLITPDGKFDGDIVYGADADPSDIMGLVDAVAAISVIETEEVISSTGDISAVGEAIKIETDTNKLNIGDNLTEVKSVALDEDDMPNILADDTYRSGDNIDYKYEQKIEFADTVEFSHWTDSDYKAKTPTLGIRIPRDSAVLDYTLLFSKAIESDVVNDDLADLEDSTIQILGKEYDIVEADNATDIKLTLMRGAIKDVLEQGQKSNYVLNGKEYAVEVTYIGGDTSRAKFKVNGEITTALEEDDTYKLSDGTQIGVREILEEEAGEVMNDMVEFYFGAEKIVLEDNEKLEIADEEVEDINVYIGETFSTKTSIDSIVLEWIADEDTFIAEDSEVSFPGLDSFKISYEGLTTYKEEEIRIENDGDFVMEITAPIKSGKATIPLLGSNTYGVFDQIGGDDVGEILRTSSTSTIIYNENTDNQFVATYEKDADGESYLLTITDINDQYGVDFKDVVSSSKYENKKPGTAFNVGSITLTVTDANETNRTVDIFAGNDCYFDRLITKEGLVFELPVNGTGTGTNIDLSLSPTTWILNATEENKEENLASGGKIGLTLGHTSDNEVEVDGVAADWAAGTKLEIGDTNEEEGYVKSDLGTRVLYDTDPDQQTAKIIYHGRQAYGNVFVSEIATTFTKTTADVTKILKQVSIPLAKSDADALKADPTMTKTNYLLVGGPCANRATAKIMGAVTSWPNCAEGFKEGVGRIILQETSEDTAAVIVAGMTALDTTRATRVLRGYATEYDMKGTEIEVVGTTSQPVTVNVVSNEKE